MTPSHRVRPLPSPPSSCRREQRRALWLHAHDLGLGVFHIPSVGLAIAGSSLVAGVLAWPLVGFLATSIYLLVIAAQFTFADGKGRVRRGGLDRAG